MSDQKMIICSECGANIDVTEGNTKSIICPFCGVTNEIRIESDPRKVKFSPNMRRGCHGCM